MVDVLCERLRERKFSLNVVGIFLTKTYDGYGLLETMLMKTTAGYVSRVMKISRTLKRVD